MSTSTRMLELHVIYCSELILLLLEVLFSLWQYIICRPWWDVQAVSLQMIKIGHIVCIWVTIELMVHVEIFRNGPSV